jgi:hypothetical protein
VEIEHSAVGISAYRGAIIRKSGFLFETGIFLPLLSSQFDAFNDCGQIVGRSDIPALSSATVGRQITSIALAALSMGWRVMRRRRAAL